MSNHGAWLNALRHRFRRPDIELDTAMEDNRRSRAALKHCAEKGLIAADKLMIAIDRPAQKEADGRQARATPRKEQSSGPDKAAIVNSQP